jgi:hypothetical protein
MDALRGGPQEDPPAPPEGEPEEALPRSVSSSGIFRVADASPPEDPGAPVSSAPPALRPDRLREVLAKLPTG